MQTQLLNIHVNYPNELYIPIINMIYLFTNNNKNNNLSVLQQLNNIILYILSNTNWEGGEY